MQKQRANQCKLIMIVAIILFVALAIVVTVLIVNKAQNEQSGEALGATAKCGDVFQCIEKLDPESSLEEMNRVVGSDAELASEKDNTKVYKWTLADDTTIEARFETYEHENSDNTRTFVTFSIEYPENLASHDADLSRWPEIKEKMGEADGVTYDQFVEMVGGVDGTIEEKSQGSKKFYWFNQNGGYLSASFDNDSGKCTFASGRA